MTVNAPSNDTIVNVLLETFSNRLTPPKMQGGGFKRNIPKTRFSVALRDDAGRRMRSVTHGDIYNYSPMQVLQSIKRAL